MNLLVLSPRARVNTLFQVLLKIQERKIYLILIVYVGVFDGRS